jgi:hypothetical protein
MRDGRFWDCRLPAKSRLKILFAGCIPMIAIGSDTQSTTRSTRVKILIPSTD